MIGLMFAFAGSAAAQVDLGTYLGPGVLTNGISNTGSRSGEQVDLRFYAGVSGFYDNNLQPVSVNAQGQLVTISGLYGETFNIGAYGIHNWKTAQLGLDYGGDFNHFDNSSSYDSSNHKLALGYTWEPTKRVILSLKETAGTYVYAIGGVAQPTASESTIVTPTTQFFDNRTSYVQSQALVTLVQSSRTFYTFGGEGYEIWRQSGGLAGVIGGTATGSVMHRLTRSTSIGAVYAFTYYNFPHFFGEADINTAEGMFSHQFGQRWDLNVRAGVFYAETKGLKTVSLDPAVAALLGGQSTSLQAFYRTNLFPSGRVSISRRFAHASLTGMYAQTVSPGNGITLTSRNTTADVTFSYTGIRKWNLGLNGGYYAIAGIGEQSERFGSARGGGGVTYQLMRSLHAVARFDLMHQTLDLYGYRREGYRASLGLAFSPGSIPLSLW